MSIRNFLRFPQVIFLCLGLTMILYFPSSDLEFHADDYHFLAMEGGRTAIQPSYWNLTSLCLGLGDPHAAPGLIEQGVIPWWSSPNLRIAFFRPLSGLLLHVDYHLFGTSPRGYHLHSLLWGMLLFGSFGLLLKRVMPNRVGVLALILYTLSNIPSLPVFWILNRTSLVACVPPIFGLLAYIRWREEGWKPGLPLSLLGVALGLAGGEMALGMVGYFLAYELTCGAGSYRQRLMALTPLILLSIGYLTSYLLFGFGATGTGGYFCRSDQLMDWMKLASVNLGILLGRSCGVLLSDLVMVSEMIHVPLSLIGYSLCLIVVLVARRLLLMRPFESNRMLYCFGLGSVLSLGPVLAAIPMDRLLVCSFLGGSVVLSFVLLGIGDTVRGRIEGYGKWRRTGHFILAGHLVLVNFILAPLITFGTRDILEKAGENTERFVENINISDEELHEREVVILHVPPSEAQMVAWHLRVIMDYLGKPQPRGWSLLTVAPYDHILKRTGARSLELTVVDGEMLTSLPERLFRSPSEPLFTGAVVDAGVMSAEILESRGGFPSKVEFDFRDSLDSEHFIFLNWKDGALQKVKPPKLGESIIFSIVQAASTA